MSYLTDLLDELATPAHALTFAELGQQRTRAADVIRELRSELDRSTRDGIALAQRLEHTEAELTGIRRVFDPSALSLVDRVAELERAGELTGASRKTLEVTLLGLVRATSLLTAAAGSSDALFKVLDHRVAACLALGIDPTSPEASATLDEGAQR